MRYELIPMSYEELIAFYRCHEWWLDNLGIRRLEDSVNDLWFDHCESNGISWESKRGWSFHNEKARVAFILRWL